DGGAASAAVGLEHVAVEPERALAERLEVDHRAHSTADQALDLDRASLLTPSPCLTLGPLAGGGGQKRVLGRHPTRAPTGQPAWNSLVDRRRAEDPRAALGQQR